MKTSLKHLSNQKGGVALGFAVTVGVVMAVSVASFQMAASHRNRQAIRMLNSNEGFYNSEIGAWQTLYNRNGDTTNVSESPLIITDPNLRASIRRYRDGGIRGYVSNAKFCGSANFDPVPGNYVTCLGLPTPPVTCASCPKIFVSSTTYDGNLGGKNGADDKCNQLADAATLSEGYWKAILLPSAGDIKSTIVINADVYNLKGEVVASQADFWTNAHGKPVKFDESGTAVASPTDAWTGVQSFTSGTTWAGGSSCSNWSSASAASSGRIGRSPDIDDGWLADGTLSCSSQARIYCISDQVRPAGPTANLLINAVDGPVSVSSGASITLSWTSSGASSCTVSDGVSNIASGTSNVGLTIANVTSATTYTLTCRRYGFPNAADTAHVNINTAVPGCGCFYFTWGISRESSPACSWVSDYRNGAVEFLRITGGVRRVDGTVRAYGGTSYRHGTSFTSVASLPACPTAISEVPSTSGFSCSFPAPTAAGTSYVTTTGTLSSPSTFTAGYIHNILSGDTWTIEAYNSASVLLSTQTITGGSPGTGNGIATPWEVSRPTAEISSVQVKNLTMGNSFTGPRVSQSAGYRATCLGSAPPGDPAGTVLFGWTHVGRGGGTAGVFDAWINDPRTTIPACTGLGSYGGMNGYDGCLQLAKDRCSSKSTHVHQMGTDLSRGDCQCICD